MDHYNISDRRRSNKKLYDVESKKKLACKLEKRIEVTMIAALDAFEKKFGFLWKHGSPYNTLNEQEKKYRQLWSDVRGQILDIGNSNLRSITWDLTKYSVSYEGYKVSFIITKDQDKDKGNNNV